jgi:hypothetical protein
MKMTVHRQVRKRVEMTGRKRMLKVDLGDNGGHLGCRNLKRQLVCVCVCLCVRVCVCVGKCV